MNGSEQAIVDAALARALMEATTASIQYISVQTNLPPWAVGYDGAVNENRRTGRAKSPAWTPDEDNFLRQHLGVLSEEEIAARLGRTPAAVQLRG